MGVLLVALAMVLPERKPLAPAPYHQLLGSMSHLYRTTPILRRRALYHACLFGSFSVFWTALPLWLTGTQFRLSGQGVAWIALAGVAGAVAPPFAGWIADLGLTHAGTLGALSLAIMVFALSNLLHAPTPIALTGIALMAATLDFAVSCNLLFGQRAIFALSAEHRSRLNSLFMATFFGAGALAAALSGWVYAHVGWAGVSALGAALPAAGLWYALTAPALPQELVTTPT
jgi:predicted MFS family arabinose efflux permease